MRDSGGSTSEQLSGDVFVGRRYLSGIHYLYIDGAKHPVYFPPNPRRGARSIHTASCNLWRAFRRFGGCVAKRYYRRVPASASDSEEKRSLIEVTGALNFFFSSFFNFRTKHPFQLHLSAPLCAVKLRNVPSESWAEMKRLIIRRTFSRPGPRWSSCRVCRRRRWRGKLSELLYSLNRPITAWSALAISHQRTCQSNTPQFAAIPWTRSAGHPAALRGADGLITAENRSDGSRMYPERIPFVLHLHGI